MLRPKKAFAQLHDQQVFYWTIGSGPDLFMIHQSGNSSEEYAGLIAQLADDFRLIAIDLPGHGSSDDPVTPPSVPHYGQACLAVLDQLQVRQAHLLAHHGGCLAAIYLLAAQPQRFRKAILSGLGGPRTPEENAAFRARVLSTPTTIDGTGQFMADAWTRYLAMASANASITDTLKPFIAFLSARLRPHRAMRANLDWDRRPALAKLAGPVLLLQGTKDSYVQGQENLVSLIPNCQRQLVKGGGAFMFYEQPQVCAGIVRSYLTGGG